jgi:Tol biopolymer transport system component
MPWTEEAALAALMVAAGCADGTSPSAPPGGYDLVFDGEVEYELPMIFRASLGGPAVPVGSGYFGQRPAASPDGRTLVFHSLPADTAPSTLLWLAETAVRPVPFLDATGSRESEAAWSPDGTRLAFAAERDDPLGDILLAEVRPGRLENLRNLTPRLPPAATLERAPAWSPEGSRIAYVSNQSGVTKLWVVNADGSGARQLTGNDPAVDLFPTWSPDGRWIAYERRGEGQIRIAIVPAEGGVPRILPWPGTAMMPAWSPEGSAIAFVSNADGDQDVYIVTPAGEPRGRIRRLGVDRHPGWIKRVN